MKIFLVLLRILIILLFMGMCSFVFLPVKAEEENGDSIYQFDSVEDDDFDFDDNEYYILFEGL